MSSKAPACASGVVTRNVGGEIVLVPIRGGVGAFDNVYLLSKVGAFLWQHLDGTRDAEALCQLVRERYRVPAERDVGGDVSHFLAELSRRGLLAA